MLWGTGIGIVAFVVLAANIADANSMLVVVLDMLTGILLVTAFQDVAFLVDDPVVADHGEVAGPVPTVNILDGDFLTDSRARTVYDNEEHVFHGQWFDLFHRFNILKELARLDCQCSGNGGHDGSYEFQHLPKGAPFYFNHFSCY